MRATELTSDYVFCIEVCQNCKDHHWNTRHDETKYNDFCVNGIQFIKYYIL
jgi:hypothetical protein